ncbi:MAG: RNA-binding protein [Selenomonadaceae bacterium]|nr:RNA-binding protein [Selenomonadaceae bacterium]
MVKEKILRFYRGTEGEETSIRLVDLATQVLKSQKFKLSEFLDPFGQEIAESVAKNFGELKLEFDGGYQGAERQRVAMIHEDFYDRVKDSISFDIVCIKAEWNENFVRLSHRDVLGSIMSLGIDRSCVGDIIATGDNARILVTKSMSQYFLDNLTRIGEANVHCEIDDLSNIAPKEERVKEISATVASLRVDSIVAAGFGFSRSKAATEIEADKVKLNWQSVKNSAQNIKQGDILSMRGRGRLEVSEIRGQTKKGRISVLLKRFL